MGMSTKNLPRENFFLLKAQKKICMLSVMDTPDQKFARFFNVLEEEKNKFGRGFNKHLHHLTGLSTGFISGLLSGKKKTLYENQVKILEALGKDPAKILDRNSSPKGPITIGPQFEWRTLQNLRKFTNKGLLLETLDLLLGIEKISSADFGIVVGEIRKHLHHLQKQEAAKANGSSGEG